MAIALHGHGGLPPSLRRRYGDIDLVAPRGVAPGAGELMRDLGYQANDRFNALNGGTRLVFYDLEHERHLDVFVGEFRMCHEIPLTRRLELERQTAPLAELLLTKLQVVEANRKDLGDATALLLEHEVGDGDAETINGPYLGSLLGADWGLWRTATGTLATVEAELGGWQLEEARRRTVSGRIEDLRGAIEAAPKSLRWRTRAKVGERVRWYEMPEEIDHADPERRAVG
ncbi:MAG: hypothetical protein JSS97_07765 [Actinobacteria bacterium]|nr:hypothetical protein [Actinomycetota bacterium]